jgi:hypothetical protein
MRGIKDTELTYVETLQDEEDLAQVFLATKTEFSLKFLSGLERSISNFSEKNAANVRQNFTGR